MPYISQLERRNLDPLILALQDKLEPAGYGVLGRLNYVITRLILYTWKVDSSYFRAAGISGVLTNVYSEFYRRVLVPYENSKIEENGDIEEYKE